MNDKIKLLLNYGIKKFILTKLNILLKKGNKKYSGIFNNCIIKTWRKNMINKITSFSTIPRQNPNNKVKSQPSFQGVRIYTKETLTPAQAKEAYTWLLSEISKANKANIEIFNKGGTQIYRISDNNGQTSVIWQLGQKGPKEQIELAGSKGAICFSEETLSPEDQSKLLNFIHQGVISKYAEQVDGKIIPTTLELDKSELSRVVQRNGDSAILYKYKVGDQPKIVKITKDGLKDSDAGKFKFINEVLQKMLNS